MKAPFVCAATVLALAASFAGTARRSTPPPWHTSACKISPRGEAVPISPAMMTVLKLWDLWQSHGLLNPAAEAHQRRIMRPGTTQVLREHFDRATRD
jgi:hypothetical protein